MKSLANSYVAKSPGVQVVLWFYLSFSQFRLAKKLEKQAEKIGTLI